MSDRQEPGVVIGRTCNELILLKTEHGYTTSIRVGPELGAKLDLGQRATVSFDANGRPTAVAPQRLP